MSESQSLEVGQFRITRADLKPYGKTLDGKELVTPFSIANYITALSFTESINSPVLFGQMTIIDSSGLLDNYALLGEEILTLSYVDFFENVITQEFIVYNVSNIMPNDQTNMVHYNLKFVSPQHIVSASRVIQKSYTGTIKDIIQKVFDEYLASTKFTDSVNDIEIEDTTGVQTLVIPSLQPIHTIDFLKRRSYSADNKSSNFYFFQNRKKFKMLTHEQMISDGKPKAISYSFDPALNANDPSNRNAAMNNLISFYLPKRLDTLDEINRGAMILDVVEVDILNKQYIHNIHKYHDTYNDYDHLDDNVRFPHTKKFMDDYFGDDNVMKSVLIFKDFERDRQQYKDIIGPRFSNYYYLNAFTAKIEIYGRNDLFAGDIINLHIPQFEDTTGNKGKSLHQSLSGYWLIQDIMHSLTNSVYKCQLTISKDLAKRGGVGSNSTWDIGT